MGNSKQDGKKLAPPQWFRAGVGAVIIDERGRVLAFRRRGAEDAWQFPQGGLEAGEEPAEAVLREIEEETGIESRHLQQLTPVSPLLAYELPEEKRTAKSGRGQVHRWFLFRFIGPEKAITLGNRKEFEDWRWASFREIAEEAIAFRKPVYEHLMSVWRDELSSAKAPGPGASKEGA